VNDIEPGERSARRTARGVVRQVLEPDDLDLEDPDLVAGPVLLLGELHEADVDRAVGGGPGRAREHDPLRPLARRHGERRARTACVAVGQHYLARAAPAVAAAVLEEEPVAEGAFEDRLAVHARERVAERLDGDAHGHGTSIRVDVGRWQVGARRDR
jgi:hypothetical protein